MVLERSLNAHEVRQVAVKAEVDPRTVRRYLDGQTLRPMTGARIKRALEGLGFQTGGSDGAPAAGDDAAAGRAGTGEDR